MSLFSDNETLEDISTRDLVYLFVPFVQAEVQDRVYFPDPTRRLVGVREAQVSPCEAVAYQLFLNLRQRALTTFVDKLVVYDIIPAAERQLFDRDAATDPARRRELKLKQWKQEKEIKTQVEVTLPSL
jgi:immunoglobulin-binding protein 1